MDGSAKVTLWRAIKTLPPRRADDVRRLFTNERHERKRGSLKKNEGDSDRNIRIKIIFKKGFN